MSDPRVYHVQYTTPFFPKTSFEQRIVADNKLTRSQLFLVMTEPNGLGLSPHLKIVKVFSEKID